MFRSMMIAGGLALAALTTGCASTGSEKPVAPPTTTAKAPAAPSAPSAPSAPAMSAAVTAAQAPGEATFSARCNGCHGSGRNGAPTVEVLATKQPSFIVEALTTGKMKGMGAALSDQDKANVAMFLTKKPV